DRGRRDVAWDRGERQVRPTLTLRVREFGEELGIDAQEPARRRFREAVSDRSDVSVADLDEGGRAGLGTVRVEKGPKVDLEDGPAYAVLPRRVRSPARAAVARPIERLAELRDLERHSGAQLDPIRVYPRRKFPALSGITEGSERGEPEPVVPEKTEDEEEHDQRPPQPASRERSEPPGNVVGEPSNGAISRRGGIRIHAREPTAQPHGRQPRGNSSGARGRGSKGSQRFSASASSSWRRCETERLSAPPAGALKRYSR